MVLFEDASVSRSGGVLVCQGLSPRSRQKSSVQRLQALPTNSLCGRVYLGGLILTGPLLAWCRSPGFDLDQHSSEPSMRVYVLPNSSSGAQYWQAVRPKLRQF
jgi:hypothetical protein